MIRTHARFEEARQVGLSRAADQQLREAADQVLRETGARSAPHPTPFLGIRRFSWNVSAEGHACFVHA